MRTSTGMKDVTERRMSGKWKVAHKIFEIKKISLYIFFQYDINKQQLSKQSGNDQNMPAFNHMFYSKTNNLAPNFLLMERTCANFNSKG